MFIRTIEGQKEETISYIYIYIYAQCSFYVFYVTFIHNIKDVTAAMPESQGRRESGGV